MFSMGSVKVGSGQKSSLHWYFYIAPLVIAPVLVIVTALLVVPTDWFARRAHVQYLMTMGYGGSLHNQTCDIAIYGDSTAMIGIYPEIITQRTGLRACDLAEFEGMTMINNTMVLDQFLQNNPRPRFIVFMYAPEALNPQSQRHNPLVTRFEAITYLFRQPHLLANLFSVMKHPEDFFDWADHGVRLSLDGIFTKPFPPETAQIRYPTLGRVPFHDFPLTSCNYGSRASVPDKNWVDSLRSKYSKDGTTVLVDSVLLPDCDPDLDYFRKELSGVIDNTVDTLPVSDYYSGGRHVTATGGVPLSTMVADQVLGHISSTNASGAR